MPTRVITDLRTVFVPLPFQSPRSANPKHSAEVKAGHGDPLVMLTNKTTPIRHVTGQYPCRFVRHHWQSLDTSRSFRETFRVRRRFSSLLQESSPRWRGAIGARQGHPRGGGAGLPLFSVDFFKTRIPTSAARVALNCLSRSSGLEFFDQSACIA